jgi:hypothetical protein
MYRSFCDALSTGDAEIISKTIDELVEPDAMIRTPLPIDATGAQKLKEVIARLHRAYPDLHVTVEDLIAEGDKVVGRNTVTGTHQGEYMGLPPTGKSVTYSEIFILRFAGGRIAETWAVVDVLSQMRQLGAIPGGEGKAPLRMSTTIEQIPAGTYALDPLHSTIGFGVRYNKLATFRSTFEKIDAQLSDGVLQGTADASSIHIDEEHFKDHLLSSDLFDVEANPSITFRSTEIRRAEDDSAEVDGELTIRGVTKPVRATGTYASGPDAFGNERVAFELETTVDRREFGLNWQTQLPDGSQALAWDVTLSVDLQLIKQG